MQGQETGVVTDSGWSSKACTKTIENEYAMRITGSVNLNFDSEAVWHDMFYHGKGTQEIMLRVLEFVGHISIPSIPCFNELNIT